jgi:hypothetical protein
MLYRSSRDITMCSRAMSLLLSSDQVPSHVSLNHLMRRNLDRIISWQSWIISFFTARMLQALSSPKNEGRMIIPFKYILNSRQLL